MLGIKERELAETRVIDVSDAGNSAQVLLMLKQYCDRLESVGVPSGDEGGPYLIGQTPPRRCALDTGEIVLTRGALTKIQAMFSNQGVILDTLYSSVPQTQQAALDEGYFVKDRPHGPAPIRYPLPKGMASVGELPPPPSPQFIETNGNATAASQAPETVSKPKSIEPSAQPAEPAVSQNPRPQSMANQPPGEEVVKPELAPETIQPLDIESIGFEKELQAIQSQIKAQLAKTQHDLQLGNQDLDIEKPILEMAAVSASFASVDDLVGPRSLPKAEVPSPAPEATTWSPPAFDLESAPFIPEALPQLLNAGIPDEEPPSTGSVSKAETLLIKQNLRSGRVIRFDGNITIIGDIHAGSEVHATGDILIWGELRGIAHAGMKGNNFSEIRALHIDAIQLRIGDFIARQPDKMYYHKETSQAHRAAPVALSPEVARVMDGEIKVFKEVVEK